MRRRIYNGAIEDHFEEDRQMLFLMGPRQVGKTTASFESKRAGEELYYFTWDEPDHREIFTRGPSAVAEAAGLRVPGGSRPILTFDEIHHAPDWKNFLKGFFDLYGHLAHILVTGSARLDVYQKGGDSLRGRYFRFRLHPFSVAEITSPHIAESEIRGSSPISDEDWFALWEYGGFPEPFVARNKRFHNRWRATANRQIFREELHDISRVQELAQVERLAEMIRLQAGSLTSYSSFAKRVRVSDPTIRRWVELLQAVFYCFSVRPYSRNLNRSLTKEPKLYLYDWSTIKEPGTRFENLVASHLLKAVHFWSDYGFGEYRLYYLRTRDQREVDFLVTREDEPWILVEAKLADDKHLSPQLAYFQEKTGAPYAFQVVRDLDYAPINCFDYSEPVIVPAKTFLSQLI